MSRDYSVVPWNIRDVAEALAWEEVDSKDFSIKWYSDSSYYETPDTPYDKYFISRDPATLEALGSGDVAPDDYALVGFTTTDGKQYLVTYADGLAFECTNRVSWPAVVSLALRLSVKTDFYDVLQEAMVIPLEVSVIHASDEK